MSTPTLPALRGTAHHPALDRAIERLAHMRWLGAAVALGFAGLVGLLTAAAMPRGPVTAGQALIVMATTLFVGLLAGVALPSRWTFALAPVAYGLALELGRLGALAPTIGDLRLDNVYGIIALVLGRGLHGLLALLPMLFGVGLGRLAAGRGRRRLPVVLVGSLAIALAVLVAIPASTPPVLGPDGRPVAGSISELATVRLGGVDQAVMIRAADPDKPVLLYLAGGPGQSDLALARAQAQGWARDFVFVDWDQRGTGKSYAALDPTEDLTLDQAVADTIELTDYLRTRFDESKVYLMGESWGTILGVLAAQRRPDLYHAWIGSGQMVDIVETDRRVYADLVAHAEQTGDASLAAKLEEIGTPPYRDIPWANANLLAWYELLYPPYTPSAGYLERGEASGLDPFGALGTEYSLVEKANVIRGLIDTFALMYPQLYDLDLRRDAARLEVPVYQLDGAAELAGRRDLALAWFEALEAPSKRRVTYEDAAHAVAFEQADAVQRLLVDEIVPATYVP